MSPRPKTPTPRLPFEDPEPRSSPGVLLDAADRAAAVDPTRNVVLEASAGTGKTRVLVDRYINLLKAGVDPRNILAITFTRKAAAEMRDRIVSDIRRAADAGEIPSARWRDLRDRMGEVAISTIDAFCLSLLREFPLEAELDPGFAVADETEVLRFVDEALDATLRVCRQLAGQDPAVGLVFAQLGEARLREGLAVLLERRLVARDALRRLLVSGPADLDPAEVCRRALGRLTDTLLAVDGGLARFLADGPRHQPRYALLAADIDRLVVALAAGGPPPDDELLVRRVRALIERLEQHFFTKNGQPRSKWSYAADDCDSADAWRRHRDRAVRLAPALADDLARFRRDLNVVLSRGVTRIFALALEQYRRTLTSHAVVDFPEALWRTLELLDQMDEFAQSRYLLEARYHHLLLDEFQDTSQAQWDLVWRLVRAWGAGLGVAQDLPLTPSIFVVGDRKQSIYGFRDADVAVIARAAREIAGIRQDPDVRRSITKSFRAVPPLLAFTNDLFAAVPKAGDRTDAFEYGERDRFPIPEGVWEGEPALGLIVDPDPANCADRVATEIARLIEHTAVRDKQTGLARPVRPGDIGILFRSREGHQSFEAALEARGIPSYVYKGLGFFDTDEIKDLVALLRYFADPSSDLRAAAVLRSRLVRLSDPALQAIAPGLAEALRTPVAAEADLDTEDRAALSQARSAFAGWLLLVDRVPPADLLDRVLDESAYAFELAGPRVAQARENLKKVRGLVRRIQNRGYATLARVAEHLDRLSAGDESNAAIDAVDAVNLMTVHAAKGLEFPVVFVVNIGKGSGGSRPAIRLTLDGAAEPSVSVGDYQSDADEDAVEREKEETKRLLYVALTRARDRLYLSAVAPGSRFRPARGSLAEVLPATLLDAIAAANGSGAAVHWTGRSGTHVLRVCSERSAATSPPLPAGVRFTGATDYAPIMDAGAPIRTPVTAVAPPAAVMTPTPGAGSSRLIGILVHRLFEHAPGGETDETLARRIPLLLRPHERVAVDDLAAFVADVVRSYRSLEARPAIAVLMTRTERWHEVPFSFAPPATIIEGTIDSLVRTSAGWVVIELKTGRPSPEHERQLSVYCTAVRAIDPDVDVTGLLVYPDHEVWLGRAEPR